MRGDVSQSIPPRQDDPSLGGRSARGGSSCFYIPDSCPLIGRAHAGKMAAFKARAPPVRIDSSPCDMFAIEPPRFHSVLKVALMWMTVGVFLIVVVIVAAFPRIALCGFLVVVTLLEKLSSSERPIPGRACRHLHQEQLHTSTANASEQVDVEDGGCGLPVAPAGTEMLSPRPSLRGSPPI